jgi:hypothetical protein
MGKSVAGLGLTERAEHPSYLEKTPSLKPDIHYYLKASFNALRKIHKNAESEQLENIIQAVTQKANNLGNKRLMIVEEEQVPSPAREIKKSKMTKITKSLF